MQNFRYFNFGASMQSTVFIAGLAASFAVCAAVNPDVPDVPAMNVEMQKLVKVALAYSGVLAAAGTISMAFVELIKASLDVRRHFQGFMLSRWLGDAREAVLPELLYLAIGDQKHQSVLTGQALDKMMGQIQAAARIALDNPDKFGNLYAFLTTSDLENGVGKSGKVDIADRGTWHEHVQNVRGAPRQSVENAIGPAADAGADAASEAAQARARLASLVARKLDGFQLRNQFWWDRGNQALALVAGIVIVFEIAPYDNTLHGIMLGIVGGLLAPFAKDFSQSLAKFAA